MSFTLSRPAVEPLATWYTQHVANQPQTHQTLALSWGGGGGEKEIAAILYLERDDQCMLE